MKMIKRTLIILIIATTIFTVVKCNRIEDADNIKQEQGEDTLPLTILSMSSKKKQIKTINWQQVFRKMLIPMTAF